MRLREAATQVTERLAAAGVPDARFEAELLAREAGGVDRAAYYAGAEAADGAMERLEALVARREQREPGAFITGTREFYGRAFVVGPGVLVPRPETEMLVDVALEELRERPESVVVDVGTGSGCVAVSVAAEAPGARVAGIDVSRAALRYAAANARRHAPQTALLLGDLASLVIRADIVLANLPYIPGSEIDALEPEVSQWEPRMALDGGPDGLSLIRRLIADCGRRLRPRVLALEVGFGQASEVGIMARAAGATIELRPDLAGIDRIVIARWR